MSKNAQRMINDANQVRRTLAVVNDAVLTALAKRAGIRATSDATSGDGIKAKGSVSDPTLNAVVKIMSVKGVQDPVWDTCKQIAEALNDMARLARSIDARVAYLTSEHKPRELQIHHCEACDREVAGTPKDRIRSGYCEACYHRWLRKGRPYRQTFRQETQKNL